MWACSSEAHGGRRLIEIIPQFSSLLHFKDLEAGRFTLLCVSSLNVMFDAGREGGSYVKMTSPSDQWMNEYSLLILYFSKTHSKLQTSDI